MSKYDVGGSQKNLLIGLKIFDTYMEEDEIWYVDAEHDEIFACGPNPAALGGDESAILLASGWSWDEENLCWHLNT